MLIVALIVLGVTVRFLGLRPGVIAGGVSLALLVVASLAPLVPLGLLIYALHAGWIAALWYLGGKVAKARRARAPWSVPEALLKRGWSLWNRRK